MNRTTDKPTGKTIQAKAAPIEYVQSYAFYDDPDTKEWASNA